MFALLRRLQVGTLDVQLPDASRAHFGSGAAGEPHAAVRLHNWQLCNAVLRSGDIGFAESFIAGDWAANSMVALLQLIIANRRSGATGGLRHLVGQPAAPRAPPVQPQFTRRRSRRDVHAHYDLGNAFYRLWLQQP